MPKNQRTAQKKARVLSNSADIPYSMALRLAQGLGETQAGELGAEAARRPAVRGLFSSFSEEIAKSLGAASLASAVIKGSSISSFSEEIAKSLGTASLASAVIKGSSISSFSEEIAKSLGTANLASAVIKGSSISSFSEEIAKSLGATSLASAVIKGSSMGALGAPEWAEA
ncbi:hypothetical protein ACFZAE_41155 [Streptomyces scabiei]|uniref:hypothetical protein n=1 Tax=Streptomyces scabiei TaxID=1930 RepID=UPI0036E9A34D